MKIKINETGEIRDITLDNRTFYLEDDIGSNNVQVMRTEDMTEDVILYYSNGSISAERDGNGVCYGADQATVDFWTSYADTNAADMDRLQALYDRYHEDRDRWAAMSWTMAKYLDADAARDVVLEHAVFMAMFAELQG